MPRRDLPEELELSLGLDEPDSPDALRLRAARALGRAVEELPEVTLRRRSIDARRGRVRFQVLLGLGAGDRSHALGTPHPREVRGERRVIVVGDGPAGLFCAHELARAGVACTVLDRGKTVQPRRHDLKGLQRLGVVDPDSNYCFGEGGAGAFSDGKLYTRAHKRGDVRDVLETLALHGAPASILVDARPHIGSNNLPKVVTALRERLEACGQVFHFGARVVDLRVRDRGRREVCGVTLADGRELGADAVVLATGHSARDVFDLLAARGVTLEAKPFALGVRVEHPQPFIDRLQYGRDAGHARLPSASYRLACEVEARGVFSFCMCPGGWIVPASTEPGELVVNGMSLSRRDSPYANSGLVVAVALEDLSAAGLGGPLGGVELQRRVERAAALAGGGNLRAPATRASDFLRGRPSSTTPPTSYLPGLSAGDVSAVLDAGGLPISPRLREALGRFDRRMPGYGGQDAVLVGVESRTSAPVRVPRDPLTLESPDLAGLYPTGEGAGYAGGIMSAAIDGIRVARAVAVELGVALAP